MKTGTSAIQEFLNHNKDFLKMNGFLYPNVNVKAMNYLAFSILDKVPPYVHYKLKDSSEVIYKELVNEISKSNCENIIISSEAFYLISTNLFLGKKAPCRLFELLGGKKFNFKIISYLRRQDDYLETQYNQHVKTHNFFELYKGDIHSFFKEKIGLFEFNKILKRWENVFGYENMIVNIYDKRVDIIESFLNSLGIKNYDKIELKSDINPKLSEKGLDFMRIANKYEVNKFTAKKNNLLMRIIESNLKNSSFKFDLLTKNDCLKIMKRFEKENVEISERYLNNYKDWFRYNINKPNVIQTNKVTVNESIKIAVDIWNHFQNKN